MQCMMQFKNLFIHQDGGVTDAELAAFDIPPAVAAAEKAGGAEQEGTGEGAATEMAHCSGTKA